MSDTFRYQLQALVDVLQSTTPWYVRCIKPNQQKLPDNYDDALVLDQLKYLGMLDIIRIRKDGYPIHMNFDDFVSRYHCLSKSRLPHDVQEACKALIESHNIKKTEWQIGKTKVFMRSHVHEPLEETRNKMITNKAVLIQKMYRGYRVRKEYKIIRKAVLRIQHAYRGWKMRIEFLRKRRAAIVIQSHLRGVFAREVASALREMRRVEEEMRKREKAEAERKAREEELAKQEKKAELERSEKAAEKEIEALSHMAEQLKPRLVEPPSESVDLDNLFAFLSEVTPQTNKSNHIIDEIGVQMNELVEDLDVELETVIQQELEGLAMEQQQQQMMPKLKPPSLPEPTGPPPPPPEPATVSAPAVVETPAPEKESNEPIYEAVLPREETSCVSPPPLPAPPKLPSESPRQSPPVTKSIASQAVIFLKC